MRVTITSERSGELTLSDGTNLNRWSVPGTVLGLEQDGLEGWYEPADLRIDDIPDIPGVHGSYWPEEVLLTSRILTIRGFMHVIDGRASSVTVGLGRDRLAGMIGQRVRIAVEDATGAREVEGYLSAPPSIRHRTERGIRFSLIFTCPDPVKYGATVTERALGTVATHNTGTAPVAPFVHVEGRIQRLTITQDVTDAWGQVVEHRFEWQGNSEGLHLDLAEGVPLDSEGYETGQLITADVIRVPPGNGSLRFSRSPIAGTTPTVTYRHGWV